MSQLFSLSHMGMSLAAGGLTTLSPCVFPVLPLVVGGAVQANRLAPLFMGAGMVASFSIVGSIVGALGPQLGLDPDSIRQFGAALMVAFALVMLIPALSDRFSAIFTPLASSANEASAHLRSTSLLGSFFLGSLLGIVWSPCSGPLLASTLTLIATGGGGLGGAIMLGFFGLGTAIPLVAVAYLSRAGFMRLQNWVLGRIHRIKALFAVVVGLTGLAILTGGDKWMESKLILMLPNAWLHLTTMI